MRKALVVLLVVLSAPQVLVAQELGLTIEAHGAFGLPIGEWVEEDEIEPGFGFGAAFLYSVLPGMLQAYAGYDRLSFGLAEEEDPLLGPVSGSALSEGFRGGARGSLELEGGIRTFLELGPIYHRVSTIVRGAGFSGLATSDWAWGFEVGGGAVVPLPIDLPIGVVPALRYRQHPVGFSGLGDIVERTTASWVVLQIGLAFDY